MVAAKDCHALISYFVKSYNDVVGSTLTLNRNRARWGFEAVLMDYSAAEARELIDFYMEHYQSPNVDWFLYNYDKVALARQERVEHDRLAVARRQETAKRLDEWRKRWQK